MRGDLRENEKNRLDLERSGIGLDNRAVIRSLDDGVMAVPISNEQRSNAAAAMEDVIHRHKQKAKR